MTIAALDMASIIKSLDQDGSVESIWAQFETFTTQARITQWHYCFLPPFEEQLNCSESNPDTALSKFQRPIFMSTISSQAEQDFSHFKSALRCVEKPVSLAEFEIGNHIVPILQRSWGEVYPQQTFLIPVFGPRAFNGCFIASTPNVSEIEKTSSVMCQMTHMAYASHLLQSVQKNTNLTTRECEILRTLSRGLSNSKIAASLSISPYTVNGYLQRIFLKIGAKDRTTAVLLGFANGLIR